MNNPFKVLSKKEFILWSVSMLVVFASNLMSSSFDILTLFAALVGVTSLIFDAKGHAVGPVLMVIFSILYGIISFRFRYWGEMITYLGMTLPMSVWSAISWIKNPSKENPEEVQIQKLSPKHHIGVIISTALVTGLFYVILLKLQTPNMLFSTISIATSFLAAALTMLRSSYYAIWYAANDVVLIVLWVMASVVNPSYIPVVVNFAIFLINDMYSFISWKKREKVQMV